MSQFSTLSTIILMRINICVWFLIIWISFINMCQAVGSHHWLVEVAVYHSLVAFFKQTTQNSLPPQRSFLLSTQSYLEDAWLISRVTLDIVPCKHSSPDDSRSNYASAVGILMGPCCHGQSLVVGVCHLMQIRVCPRFPNPIYSLYSGIKWSWFTRNLSPGEMSLLMLIGWNKVICCCYCLLPSPPGSR